MKFFICLFFSLITTNFCFCQANVIFKEYKEDSLIIKYTGIPTNKENKSDYIVEKLSKNIPKDINLTHYTFSFSYKVIITKTGKTSKDGGKIFSASIEASNKKCTGDVYYKSFSIANQLSPSAFDFTLLIEDVRNNTLTPIPFVIPIKYGFGKKENIEFRDDATDSIAKIKLTNKIFYYNDSIITLFNNRIQLIDDYYNSASIISSAFEKLKFINLDNAEIVKVYEINLKEVEATITELTNKNFPDQLNLSENDPINFISKFNQLDQKAKNLRLLINQMLNNLDEVFYNKGIEYLTKSDTASALNYLDKTTIANPNYYRAFYQLAKIYFDQKKYDKAFPLITTITTKLNPDQIYFKQTIQLGYDIYSIYISNANDLINLEKHHEALEILGKLKSFCSSTPAIVCSDDIQKDISKAINGIYMSFIIVSQKAIEKEILNIGEIYTIKAKEYQQSNSTEIPSSADADGLLNQLVNKLTINGLKLNAEQKYDTALVLLKIVFDL